MSEREVGAVAAEGIKSAEKTENSRPGTTPAATAEGIKSAERAENSLPGAAAPAAADEGIKSAERAENSRPGAAPAATAEGTENAERAENSCSGAARPAPTPYAPAALAYLGDAVLEAWVRERLVRQGLPGSRELNAAALNYVTAPRQAAATKLLLPLLEDDEAAIFRRGRNLGHTSLPRHATAAEYRAATGLEALLGYLRLCGREERIAALLSRAYPDI